jgi:hypothetical protein
MIYIGLALGIVVAVRIVAGPLFGSCDEWRARIVASATESRSGEQKAAEAQEASVFCLV